jgi:hypothetical protein
MPIVRLTDDELDAIMSAARPLEASRRDAFLQHVASSLKHCGELGPGVVYRVVAEVQRDASILRTSRARATRVSGARYMTASTGQLVRHKHC